MKRDILITGVGGQGILTIAAILGRAALTSGLHVKQSEVHGMAQRGGSVQSHLRISSGVIHSDLIPHASAHMLIAMEPMEALRYLAWLAPDGWLVVNEAPVANIPDYPDPASVHEEVRKIEQHVLFDASQLAAEAGARRSVNVAMLGAASPFTELPGVTIEQAIAEQFSRKGETVVEANLAVFRAARAVAEERRGS
jgi:indolepyruvate ferredoxin oxidoreductase beta subunit